MTRHLDYYVLIAPFWYWKLFALYRWAKRHDSFNRTFLVLKVDNIEGNLHLFMRFNRTFLVLKGIELERIEAHQAGFNRTFLVLKGPDCQRAGSGRWRFNRTFLVLKDWNTSLEIAPLNSVLIAPFWYWKSTPICWSSGCWRRFNRTFLVLKDEEIVAEEAERARFNRTFLVLKGAISCAATRFRCWF